MKKTILAAVLGLGLVAQAPAETLLVGTEATFAPFEYVDTETKEITGFDIDMIRAVAKAVGDDVKIGNMGFDALIPSLQTGVINVAAAAMTITPQRARGVSFSEPYYQSGLVILINKENEKTITDLKALEGRKICVQIGTTGAMTAQKIKGAKVTNFNSITEAFMELKNKGCDAVLNDRPVVEYYLARRGDKTVTTVNQVFEAESYGFAVRKGNKELVEKLNLGLKRVKESGEYEKIYQKWFGNLH